MTNIAIFPGTFDPITLGHQDLIERAASIFDQVIVAVAENNIKKPLFGLNERITLAESAVRNVKNVKVAGFNNLLVEFAAQQNAKIIIRGVRIATDFEYELQLANMNKTLNPKIETLFLTPAENYSYVSSTLVKEICRLKGDINSFVNSTVKQALQDKLWL